MKSQENFHIEVHHVLVKINYGQTSSTLHNHKYLKQKEKKMNKERKSPHGLNSYYLGKLK